MSVVSCQLSRYYSHPSLHLSIVVSSSLLPTTVVTRHSTNLYPTQSIKLASLLEELAYKISLDTPDLTDFPSGTQSLTPPSPYQASHTVKMSKRPTFAFCGTFSGKEGSSASRWLKKFEYELSYYKDNTGTIPTHIYLDQLDMLLTDDAADWAESHPDAARLLAERLLLKTLVISSSVCFVRVSQRGLLESCP